MCVKTLDEFKKALAEGCYFDAGCPVGMFAVEPEANAIKVSDVASAPHSYSETFKSVDDMLDRMFVGKMVYDDETKRVKVVDGIRLRDCWRDVSVLPIPLTPRPWGLAWKMNLFGIGKFLPEIDGALYGFIWRDGGVEIVDWNSEEENPRPAFFKTAEESLAKFIVDGKPLAEYDLSAYSYGKC